MLSARLAGKACALLILAACAQTQDADLASPSVDTEVNIEPTTQASIDRAMLAVKAAEVAPVPFGDCASPDLERLLSGLQPVEKDADAAVDPALASTGVAEREAALNQADSLHGLAIDGYMSVATALRENRPFSVKQERFRSSKHFCTKTHCWRVESCAQPQRAVLARHGHRRSPRLERSTSL